MHRSRLGSLSLVLLLAACDSGSPPKPDAEPSTPAAEATKPSQQPEAKVPATAAANRPAEGAATKPAGADEAPTLIVDPAPVEPDPAAAIADEDIDVSSPSAPLATLLAFAGPLRFIPEEAGDGKLPASNRASIDAGEPTMMDHPTEFGWAADSGSFGYCQPSGGADCEECRVVSVASGAVETWIRGSECDHDDRKEIAARWKASGFGKQPIPKQWAFGRDLAIAWKRDAGQEAEKGVEGQLAQLQIGAKVGNEEPVYFVTMTEASFGDTWFDYMIFPELIIPSPDGQQLAIMSHSFAGEYSDTMSVRVQDVTDFAFEAYALTARGLLASKPARAAELLEAAAQIKPGAAKVQHERVRARALAGMPSEAK